MKKIIKLILIVLGGFVLLMAMNMGMAFLHVKYNAIERIQTELYGSHHFQWKDVEACIDEDAEVLKSRCLKCGRRKKKIYYRSPDWTWRELCGRRGELTICEHCKRQYEFECIGMN